MFKTLKTQMQAHFLTMSNNQSSLFVVDVDRDTLWDTYLNSIPQETRQEFNCNCCRQFIKNYATIVSIIDNKVVTIWDFVAPDEYVSMVAQMKALVTSASIKDNFLSEFNKLGTDRNVQYLDSGNITWDHFFINLSNKYVNKTSLSVQSIIGAARDVKNVFQRGLNEITLDSVQTIIELISQNSLYKGQEFLAILNDFRNHKIKYEQSENKDNYCWINSKTSIAVSKIRNSAIGTLLTDLSEGKELDYAVTSFERMVAPTNYKRPTAIVTKSMVEESEKIIKEMGMENSLERMYASVDDISVNNLLFVNRNAKKANGIFEEMIEDVQVNVKSLSKTEEITIDKFISDVLPNITSMDVLVENKHLSNLVSLIGPKDKEAPGMFKWHNPFSWSYTNALTDSIKEQVKAAGGKVEGYLRISLSWFNTDDLDLSVVEPKGNTICYSNKTSSYTDGNLDVDMNVDTLHRDAVENIIYTNQNRMIEGDYSIKVTNFNQRESIDTGYEVEVEINGELFSFQRKSIKNRDCEQVVKFNYSKKNGVVFLTETKSSVLTKEKWNVSTNKYHKVSMLMNSPNYWNEAIGNKHLFFILEGAENDEAARGFFNEFLKEDLLKNKRVFEVLGSKLKVEPSSKQLSGIGFSTTQKNNVIVRVEGKFKRLLKINF